MRTNYLFCCLLVGCTLLARAETPVPASVERADDLSLQQALELALNANAEIAVALREREAIEGMQLQAAARPNPQFLARMEDTRSATRETFVELAQPIELGNKRAFRIAAADRYHDAASAALAVKKADIRAHVIAAFYHVLTAQERLLLAQSSLEVAQRAREAASKRVQAGKVSPVEETRARIAESSVRVELNQAKTALMMARSQLASLWGNALPAFGRAQGRVELIEPVLPLDQLHQLLPHAPALQQAQLEVDTRSALVDVEKSKTTPDIIVNVGTKHSAEQDANQAVLGLTVPIPLFDRNQGNIQQALSRADKARAEVAALRIQLKNALALSHAKLEAARQAADSYQTEILPDAQSALNAASKGFEFGKFSYLEVLDAQRTLVQAKTHHLNALLEAHQAAADIQRILGDAISPRDALPQEPQ